MSKRPCPFADDFQRQVKTHVNEARVNGNNSSAMTEIFGARRAASEGSSFQEYRPGSSGGMDDFHNNSSMDLDDYETYEMQADSGIFTSFEEVEQPERGPGSPINRRSNTFFKPLIRSFTLASINEIPEEEEEEGDEDDQEVQRILRCRTRLDNLRNIERRDPSPIPSANNLITSFIHSTRRMHGPLSDEEKKLLISQAKNYRQLNIDSFIRREEPEGKEKEPTTECTKGKDENENKPMEF